MFARQQFLKLSRNVVLSATVAAVAGLANTAMAQVRQVHNSNPMDANMQVGSGGSNTPVPGFTPVNGNDIFTGNVGGLKYFHGNVPYSSPFEFRGNIGSSRLNNFERQSYTGVPLGGSYQGISTPYYTPSRQVSGEQGNYYAAPSGSGISNRLLPSGALSPTTTTTNVLGTVIYATPTLNAQANARRYGDLTVNPADISPLQPSGLFGFKNALQAPIIEKPIDRLERERKEQEEQKNRRDIGAGLGLGKPVEPIAKAIEPVKSGVLPVGQAEDDSEVYKNLQAQLVAKRNAAAKTPVPVPNKTPTGTVAATPGFASAQSLLAGRTGSTPGAGAGEFAIPHQSDDPSKPFYRPSGLDKKAPTEESTETLKTGKDIAPIGTFKGGKDTVFDQYMKIAEKQLMDGRYLDAADTYQSAGQISPDNPLTLIGRAHAELAAGMYLAGVEDLQIVFKKRPEMMALRYDLKAFIPQQRLEHLMRDIARLARQAKANPSANFALAYLTYQLSGASKISDDEKKRLLEDLTLTFDVWKRQAPQDTWHTVLERAWSEEKKEK
jgi:hypothetical protein